MGGGGAPGQLGGSTSGRAQSKLLTMRRAADTTPPKPTGPADHSLDEDELLEDDDGRVRTFDDN